MARVILAGVAVLDFVFHMDAFPRTAEKYRANGADIMGGGNAANAAVAIARLGGDAQLCARLGDDQVADMIIAGLTEEGVETSRVRRFPTHRSSFSSIYIDGDGERQIMNYRDTSLSMDADWINAALPERFDAALADTRWPQGAEAILQAAKARGVPGVLDAEAPVMEANAALYCASHVAFSAQGAEDFTGLADAERAAVEAARRLPGKIYVTDGARGTVSMTNGCPVWHDTFAVIVSDSLGAGDTWHGAFTLALAEGMEDAAAIRFANAAAALKCANGKGRDGAPARADVMKLLEEQT